MEPCWIPPLATAKPLLYKWTAQGNNDDEFMIALQDG